MPWVVPQWSPWRPKVGGLLVDLASFMSIHACFDWGKGAHWRVFDEGSSASTYMGPYQVISRFATCHCWGRDITILFLPPFHNERRKANVERICRNLNPTLACLNAIHALLLMLKDSGVAGCTICSKQNNYQENSLWPKLETLLEISTRFTVILWSRGNLSLSICWECDESSPSQFF